MILIRLERARLLLERVHDFFHFTDRKISDHAVVPFVGLLLALASVEPAAQGADSPPAGDDGASRGLGPGHWSPEKRANGTEEERPASGS